jgi:hypothetical protein
MSAVLLSGMQRHYGRTGISTRYNAVANSEEALTAHATVPQLLPFGSHGNIVGLPSIG